MKQIRWVVMFVVASFLFMSQIHAGNPAEQLRSMYRGHFKPMIPMLAPDVEWVMAGDPDIVPLAGTYVGFRPVLLHWFEFFKKVKLKSIKPEYVFTDENDKLHVIFSLQGKVRANGNRFNLQFAHLLTFNERGQIAENRIFYDTTSWWAAFNKNSNVKDRRVGQRYDHLDAGNLGASTQTVTDAYDSFAQGDVLGVLEQFHPTDFLWILKGDAIGDSLGATNQGIAHVGRWEGIGNPFEQPYPSSGFLGFLTAMNSTFEYVLPEPPDWELPFQVFYLGSNGNFAGAHVQEIQRHLTSRQTAKFEIYHFFVLDEEQKVQLGFSFNDNAALCRVDPNCAFYEDMQ